MLAKFQAVGSHEAGDMIDAPIRVVGHRGKGSFVDSLEYVRIIYVRRGRVRVCRVGDGIRVVRDQTIGLLLAMGEEGLR